MGQVLLPLLLLLLLLLVQGHPGYVARSIPGHVQTACDLKQLEEPMVSQPQAMDLSSLLSMPTSALGSAMEKNPILGNAGS